MRQILQNIKAGETEAEDVPCPNVHSGALLIRSSTSLVSPGTERMLVDFSESNLIGKARQQPHKVRQVLDKVRTVGLAPALQSAGTSSFSLCRAASAMPASSSRSIQRVARRRIQA